MGGVLAIAGVVACGGSATSDSGGTAGGTATGGGTGTGTGTGAGGTSLCPPAPPADGDSCAPRGEPGLDVAHCSWGDDPRPSCRTTGLCNGEGQWVITAPAASCQTPPLPAACDATPPSPGTTCADIDLACWYADGPRCWCSACEGGSPYPICQTIDPPEWACASPPAGCPDTIPHAGASCSDEGLSCGPDCELQVLCEDAVWVWKQGECPMCASPTTPVATPDGEIPIAALRVGDLVFSVEGDAFVVVPVRRVGSTKVARHRVVQLVLDDGRALEVSGSHPTADGRTFEELAVGDRLDGRTVVSRRIVPYAHARTYDILPASSTGTYVAAGIRLGSTLER